MITYFSKRNEKEVEKGVSFFSLGRRLFLLNLGRIELPVVGENLYSCHCAKFEKGSFRGCYCTPEEPPGGCVVCVAWAVTVAKCWKGCQGKWILHHQQHFNKEFVEHRQGHAIVPPLDTSRVASIISSTSAAIPFLFWAVKR